MYFNTSHVTVYRQIRAAPFGMWIFQYISCYGLSRYQDTVNSILELFQYISCYGLSSVLVCKICDFFLFQYISCYGLSYHFSSIYHMNFLFQYISCYGLSCFGLNNRKLSIMISIHLMLRFIFQELLHIMQLQHYFNTSHVTVYHTATKLILKLLRFQYISCYGLSDTWELGLADVYIFQYISCYGLSI